MNYEKIRRYADLVVLVIGAVLLSYLFFKHVFVYLLPFFIGWFLAFATRPLAARISPVLRIKPKLLCLILTVLIFLVLFGLTAGGVWLLSREVWELLGRIGSENGALIGVLTELFGSGRFFDRLFGEFGDYIADAVYRIATSMLSSLGSVLSAVVYAVPKVLFFVLVSVIASAYFAVGLEDVNQTVRRLLPKNTFEKLVRIKNGFFGVFVKYMRSYLLLLVITFFEMLVGLFLVRAPYPLLLATVIAVLDLLPVIGVGSVLIPWGVWSFAVGRTPFGVALLVLFVFHTVLRQVIEPKIVGKNLGVHPLLTLAFIYVGYSVFGAVGLLLVPIFTVLIKIAFDKDNTAEVAKSTGSEGDNA